MTAEPGSPQSSGTPASDSQRPQHHVPKHPTGTSHGSATPNPQEQLSQSEGSLRATSTQAPTLGRRHLPLVELLEALLVGLAVVVDLRLRSRVELDVADLAEREGLLLLLPLQALLGLATGRLHQLQTVLRAVGRAQGSLHACGGKDRAAIRTDGPEEGPGEVGKPSTGPTPAWCPGCPDPELEEVFASLQGIALGRMTRSSVPRRNVLGQGLLLNF